MSRNKAAWLAVALVFCLTGSAGATEAAAGEEKERYIMVLGPGNANKPDVEAADGTIEHEWSNRIEVRVPAEAIRGLKQHPRVKYMQFIAPNATGAATAPSSAGPAYGKSGVSPQSLSSEDTVRPAATWSWTTGTYSYDGAGNITRMTSTNTDTFSYDTLSRLTGSTIHVNGAPKTESYTYDNAGNMTSRTTNNVTLSMPVNLATNRLTGATYDGAGNMTGTGALGSHTYTWDAVKMMKTLADSGGRQFEYVYTADDERIAVKDVNPGIWRWTIRGFDGKVLREFESSVTIPSASWLWIEDYAYRNGQLAGAERMPEEGGRRHFHLDHLGTPRLITNSAGDKIADRKYYPFGREATPLLQETTLGYDREDPMKFTGHERDHVGGTLSENVNYVDYMHARHYSPNLGRFVSVDPVGGRPTTPQSWNRYSYTFGNPLKYVDPNGETAFMVFAKGGVDPKIGYYNPFGHVAIAVDRLAFSYGTNWSERDENMRDWAVSLDSYLRPQDGVRTSTLYRLTITAEEEARLLQVLLGNNPNSNRGQDRYNVFENSCVSVLQQALVAVGLLPEQSILRGASPTSFLFELNAHGLVEKIMQIDVQPQQPDFFLRSPWASHAFNPSWGTWAINYNGVPFE